MPVPHVDDDGEAVVRAAAGWLVRLALPTDSPWLTPIELWWRQCRRQVTHGALLASVKALLQAAQECFDRDNLDPPRLLSILGSPAA